MDCDHGLMILNASDVKMYQNTFINSTACIGRNARSAAGDHFGWHPSTGPAVDARSGHEFVNNLLVRDERSVRPLLFVWQPDSMRGRLPDQQLQACDNNVFASSTVPAATPLIVWSPVPGDRGQARWQGPEDLHRQFPRFAARTVWMDGAAGQVFTSRELGNYRTVGGFKGMSVARSLPDEVRKAAGVPRSVPPYVGAYRPGE